MLNRYVIFRMLKFFLMYFLIYAIVSYFMRGSEHPFISFASLSQKVTFAAFMSMFTTIFDGKVINRDPSDEGDQGAPQHYSTSHILQGLLLFLLFSVPLIFILYFVFSDYYNEDINLLKEFLKLGVYTLFLAIVILVFGWFMSRRARNRRKDL